MPRAKKNKSYDAAKIIKALMAAIAESYAETGELKLTAEEFSMSALKVRKLLITAGVYHSDLSDKVCALYKAGKSPGEIQRATLLGRSSVNGYLPYTKIVYKPEELSLNAQRIAEYRRRKKCVAALQEKPSEKALWEAVVAFQNYPFYTVAGVPFSYTLKKNRDGSLGEDFLVSCRKENETFAWNSIALAFRKALEMTGEVIDRPKALGDKQDVTYIYPMLYRFGLITVPEKAAEKMWLKGGKAKRRD